MASVEGYHKIMLKNVTHKVYIILTFSEDIVIKLFIIYKSISNDGYQIQWLFEVVMKYQNLYNIYIYQ